MLVITQSPIRRRERLPTPVVSLGEIDDSPWSHKELDMTEQLSLSWTSPVAQMVKRLPTTRETWVRSLGSIPGFDPWVRKISWRRKWQPTPVLLPGKAHGWRNLVGYSPWGRKESDTTEHKSPIRGRQKARTWGRERQQAPKTTLKCFTILPGA